MGTSTKHLEFQEKPIPHHTTGTLGGGKCFAKHAPSKYTEGCSCSHRWQAFEKALDNASQYEVTDERLRSQGDGRWALLFRGGAKAVAKLGGTAVLSSDNKGMYRHEVQKPRKGDWDVARGKYNFKFDCNKPYYHEAHHVVPDATLRAVIVKVFPTPELAVLVASAVLDAPYNVHHKDNMLILPMDERVGDLLQLPIHREAKQCNHNAYDLYVEKKLKSCLQGALQQIMEKHGEEGGDPQYKDLAKSIEKLSIKIYGEVISARRVHGHTSIEELGRNKRPPSSTSS